MNFTMMHGSTNVKQIKFYNVFLLTTKTFEVGKICYLNMYWKVNCNEKKYVTRFSHTDHN
jgi:hypothetical protein